MHGCHLVGKTGNCGLLSALPFPPGPLGSSGGQAVRRDLGVSGCGVIGGLLPCTVQWAAIRVV